MAKIVNISEIHPTLGFTEFDILEKYRKSFNESELGKLHSVFPFECMAKAAGLSDRRLGRRNRFSPSAKIALMVLKAYTGFSDRQLVEHLNGNIHYQIFCGIMIPPSLPITNFKIVSAIRNEIASRLDIDSFQELLASHWKPYLDNLHVCMTDATCYESHMRFPTDMKLLWESLEWLYRHICRHCRGNAQASGKDIRVFYAPAFLRPNSSSQSQAARIVPQRMAMQQTISTGPGTVPRRMSPNSTAQAE